MPLVRPFGVGAKGDHVRDLQRRLVQLGFETLNIDGLFGDDTREAVEAFQRADSLDVDGICGPQTWTAVVEAGRRFGERLLYLHSPAQRGEDVVQLQQLLSTLGFGCGRIDGILDERTARALVDFQRNSGLAADGICGPETRLALERVAQHLGETAGVATIIERERILAGPQTLSNSRIVIGELGGLEAFIAAVRRPLVDAGARVVTVHHPDWSQQAAQANEFDADVFLGIDVRSGAPTTCFYASDRFVSMGGQRLAILLAATLSPLLGHTTPEPMRLPILRETRMTAVLCRVPTATELVRNGPMMATAIEAALSQWRADPFGDHEGLGAGEASTSG